MIPKDEIKGLEMLYKAVLGLDSEADCENLFTDLCTIAELKSMSQRIQVAKMLSQGIVYSKIAAQTGASTATISRVNRCLMYGAGGYKAVVDKI